MDYTLGQDQLEKIEVVLQRELINDGVHSALIIDRAGNIITKYDNGQFEYDLYSLAALASANFAAVDTMAKIVGEQEFSLLFHKGKNESIHFSKVNNEVLLITIFGKDLSLGLLRLKIEKAAGKIRGIWK
ncbi:MAG: roadblock/LC7 domain-containing protein [Desulfobacteraceae bacterium]|nr:roadblock/LC7 domain-containing protein [Desulfobacteraceae bacterium]MCP4348699.1 roadblock/LC7 domain-containing protein [Desulfobacterales bacterium]